MLDPELFGRAMGEEIVKAVAPLRAEIAELKKQLEEKPDYVRLVADEVSKALAAIRPPQDGKDCDMEAVKSMVVEAVNAIPAPKDGRDGANGLNGADGKDGAAGVEGKDGLNGKDGADGKDGTTGERGEKGADGAGLAGAMLDREGALLVTLTNGDVKSLGQVVGKNGTNGVNGKDGQDGIGFDSFDLEYLEETHEVRVKASCAGRTKELRYPAGGLRPAGYWREGTKAKACEAWVQDGSTWFAVKDTTAKPQAGSEDWIIAARKGRDGETIVKTVNAGPPPPIKLGS